MYQEILKQAIDIIKGVGGANYSKAQNSEAMRNALIELNGGTDKLDIKKFHRGNELFALVEELIPTIIEEGFKEDNPLFNLVEYRNIKDGDLNEFYTEGVATFIVADTAAGIRGIRRQRISDGTKVTVKTTMKGIRVYENLGRLLSGRVTFSDFVDRVATAFKQKVLEDAYKAIAGITEETAGLSAEYVQAGTFDEDKLVAIIDHVEAATGKTAKIYGTRSALRKVKTAVVADEAKSDMYNLGYYGKFNGTDMICLKQAHKPGTTTFVLDDTKLYIIASDDKPIKIVNEGEGYIVERDPSENNDLTQEYVYLQGSGSAVVLGGALGVYTISA